LWRLKKALTIDSTSAEAHLARARYLWLPSQNYNNADAIQECRRAIKFNPDLTEAHELLASLYVHSGLLKEAVVEAMRARQADPTNGQATITIAEAQTDEGDCEKALVTLESVPDFRILMCRFIATPGAI